MPLIDDRGPGDAGDHSKPPVIVIVGESRAAHKVASSLETHGVRNEVVEGVESFGSFGSIAAIVVAEPAMQSIPRWTSAAARVGIPALVVTETLPGHEDWFEGIDQVEDWVSIHAIESEVPFRVAKFLKRETHRGQVETSRKSKGLTVNADFFGLVVHDLRTPLNVISLSMRMIREAIPKGDPEIEEDLRFVEENFWQIERMLTQLSDYYRLYDPLLQLNVSEFNPKRMVEELVESRTIKAGPRASPISVTIDTTCPEVVELDPVRARLALHYVLMNATSASPSGEVIRLRLSGETDRWVVKTTIDHPAPQSVKATTLQPQIFERLCGIAAERRGMDLAIAAKVTEMFSGTARLDLIADRGTEVLIDWPIRMASS